MTSPYLTRPTRSELQARTDLVERAINQAGLLKKFDDLSNMKGILQTHLPVVKCLLDCAEELTRLRALNAELLEALEFYADPKTYTYDNFPRVNNMPEIIFDRGGRARKAIAKTKAKESGNG